MSRTWVRFGLAKFWGAILCSASQVQNGSPVLGVNAPYLRALCTLGFLPTQGFRQCLVFHASNGESSILVLRLKEGALSTT